MIELIPFPRAAGFVQVSWRSSLYSLKLLLTSMHDNINVSTCVSLTYSRSCELTLQHQDFFFHSRYHYVLCTMYMYHVSCMYHSLIKKKKKIFVIRMNQQRRQFYSNAFRSANPNQNGSISARNAVHLLRKSMLPKDVRSSFIFLFTKTIPATT